MESGARNVDHILTGSLLPDLSREFLTKMAEGKAVSKVRIGVSEDAKFMFQIE